MQIRTEEFMALKMAVGIIEDHREDLISREVRQLENALDVIRRAEERLAVSNKKQAAYMKQRRAG